MSYQFCGKLNIMTGAEFHHGPIVWDEKQNSFKCSVCRKLVK